MAKYKVSIEVTADEPAKVQQLGGLIQNAVNVVPNEDMIRLLDAVRKNPKIVKTALKFL